MAGPLACLVERGDTASAVPERWRSRPGIHVAMEAHEVADLLDRVLAAAGLQRPDGIGEASEGLITALRDLVHGRTAGRDDA